MLRISSKLVVENSKHNSIFFPSQLTINCIAIEALRVLLHCEKEGKNNNQGSQEAIKLLMNEIDYQAKQLKQTSTDSLTCTL